MSFLHVVAVLFFASIVTVNLLLWNHMMAEADSTPSWLSRNLPGINVLALVAGAFLIGGLLWQLENLGTQLNDMRKDMKAGFSSLNNEVFQSDNSLKIRASRTEDELKRIAPRIIRSDYDAEIARLNREIDRLRTRDDIDQEIRRLNQEIDKLRDENRLLQKQIEALKAELAAADKKRPPT